MNLLLSPIRRRFATAVHGDAGVGIVTVIFVMALVTAPSSPFKVYAGPKGKKIAATCMAEPSMKDLAIEVCSSLRSTK